MKQANSRVKSILVDHGLIVTMDKENRIIRDGAILIKEGKIVATGGSEDVHRRCGEVEHVIDARGKAVLPGLVNAHDHADQTIARTLAYDLPVPIWDTNYMFKTGIYGSEEDFYYLGMVTYAEMLKTGTTTFAATHAYHRSWGNFDSLAKAAEDTGIRGMLAFGVSDKARVEALRRPLKETFRAFERAYTKLNGKADGRIGIWIAPSGFGMSSNEAITGSVELAKKHRTRLHMHVSGNWAAVQESLWKLGKTEVAYMRDVGLLGSNTLAAHCTWVNDDDIDILKETNTHVVHNPVSNMYLAAGVAPVPKMHRAGINVALGTDGLGSNTKDMFEIMRIAGYLHKVHNMDTRCISATKLLEMATINGAMALGLQQSIGSLEEGKRADLIVVSLKRLHLTPFKDVIPALVYCAKGSDVDTVIVNGNVVVEHGLLLMLNEEDLIEKARKKFEDLWVRGAYY